MASNDGIPLDLKIPDYWDEATLLDVCHVITDGTHKTPKYQTDGIRFLSIKNIRPFKPVNWDSYERYISHEEHRELIKRCFPERDDILFPRIGTLGFAKRIDFDETVSLFVGLGLLKPNKTCVTPQYLEYWMNSPLISELSRSHATGSGRLTLALKSSRRFPIPLPPLPEQERIVAMLDEAFAAIDTATANTEKNLANAKELFEQSTARAFLKPDSKNWPLTTVQEIAVKKKGSMRTGPFGSQLLHKEFTTEGIAVLGIDNAVNNSFAWDQRRFISEDKFLELSRFEAYPGDVVITIMGTCGRCAVLPEDLPKAITSKHLCCITTDRDLCNPEFLHFYFLHHPRLVKYLKKHAKGAIMAGLNMTIIKSLPLELPPLDTQHDLVKQFHKIKDADILLSECLADRLTLLTNLKQSLLQKAFTGELTADPKVVDRTLSEASV